MLTQNLELIQGDTWIVDIEVRDSLDELVDLTGFVIRAQMRKRFSSAVAYSFEGSSDSPLTGILTIIKSADETKDVPKGKYVYDVEIERAGIVYKPVGGSIVVKPEVTR